MLHECYLCQCPIKEGERVQVIVRSTYHRLKSKISYALDKDDLEAIPQSLVHIRCVDPISEVLN